MISVKTDLHTHTLASMHAYSTIEENLRNAASLGLEAVGIADHFSGLFYPSDDFGWYGSFTNYKALPPEWYGVRFLKGMEADIVDLEGHLFGWDKKLPAFMPGVDVTYEEALMPKMDYVIASVHLRQFADNASLAACTDMYLKVLEHPKVMILGHIIRGGIPFDMDTVLNAVRDSGKMLEINDGSFIYPEQITGGCRRVAERCAELGVPICVNSDAHSAYYVGRYTGSVEMLEAIHFPQDLIANRDLAALTPFLEARK